MLLCGGHMRGAGGGEGQQGGGGEGGGEGGSGRKHLTLVLM